MRFIYRVFQRREREKDVRERKQEKEACDIVIGGKHLRREAMWQTRVCIA